jgi:hypothetical protein
MAGVRYVLWVATEDPRWLPKALGGWAGDDVTLRLRPALSIEGVVVDEDGEPPGAAWVEARHGEETERVAVDRSGRFRFARLEPGDYEVTAGLVDGAQSLASADPETRTVSAGTPDLRLVIPVKPVLFVRVDPAPAVEEALEEWLLPEGDRGLARTVEVGTEGARVRRLQPDISYTVWLPPTREGYGLARGVRAPGRVDLVRRPGQAITVRVGGEVLDARPYVRATLGGIHVDGKRLSDGRFEIAGLPPGTWTVSVFVLYLPGAEPLSASTTAEPGSTVTLEVPPRPR